jgi:Ca-activated chloride channel family protein
MTNEFEALQFLEDLKNEFERKLGSLRAAQGAQKITLPLDSVDIKASVIGRVTEVTVTQVFKNPYSEHLEAEYIFPLAGCSSVNGFKMHVAGRTVIGTIQERRAARQEYQHALSQGKRASLLEQERDDVFTMQVGNIPPKESITVELTYTEKLEFFEDGTTELRLPLVVAPRYVPGSQVAREQVGDGVNFDTNLVPDASRVSPPRLADGLDPNVSLSISVEITPDVPSSRDGQSVRISDLSCSQHAVKSCTGDGVITVTLAKANELMNRDFILKWKLVSESMTSSVVLFKKAGENFTELEEAYGLLSLVPPALAGVAVAPRDVVFLVDRSGSMTGEKMSSASRACTILLSTLGPSDRFAINAFDDCCQWYAGSGFPANPGLHYANVSGIEAGNEFLRNITARGGTEMHNALVEALNLIRANAKKGRVPVVVILTDGQVSNESQLYYLAQQSAKDTRIFTIGIDTAINSPLLKRLASLAGGTSAFVVPGTQLEDALIDIGREIGAPLVTDLKVECLTDGVKIDSMAPGRLRDLFAGRTSDGLFRVQLPKDNKAVPKFCIKGRLANGKKFSQTVSAQMVGSESVARLWAREYIKELEDKLRSNIRRDDATKAEIINLSLQFSILTRFTAFVAVDQSEVVNTAGELRQVVQPVHKPDQWEQASQQTTGVFGFSGIDPAFFGHGTADGGTRLKGLSRGRVDQPSSGAGLGWGASSFSEPKPQQISGSYGCAGDMQSLADSIRQKIAERQAGGASDFDWQDLPCYGQPPDNAAPPVYGAPPVHSAGPAPASPQPAAKPPSGPDDSDGWKPYGSARLSKAKPASPGGSGGGKNDASIASVWSTMKKLFTASAEKAQTPNGAPVNRVINALTAFREAWIASWIQIGKGAVPDADKIEAVRKELIEALSDHPVGFEVPLIQKFLRSSAIKYVAALQASDVSAWSIYKSRSRFHDGFVDAMVEAEAAILQVQGRQGAFWESNV